MCSLLRLAWIYKQRVVCWNSPICRYINCNSCGVELQNTNADKRGYYLIPKDKIKRDSIQDIKYLLFSQDIQNFHELHNQGIDTIENSITTAADVRNPLNSPLICKRCSDLLYQNKYDINDFKGVSLSSILQKIPRHSRLVLMSPLNEFPFHIDKKLLLDKNYNPTLVLTKSDQIISKKFLLPTVLPKFFQYFFKTNLDIKNSISIVGISTVKKWNIANLLSMLGKESYLVGNANVGKSTLINSLLKDYFGFKMHYDQKGKLTKPKNVDTIVDHNINSFLRSQRAGVSYVPNMTQAVQPYQINNKIIYDMPGYSTLLHSDNSDSPECDQNLEILINKSWLQRIRKTELTNYKRVKNKPYSSFSGTENGSVYTVGGIFYLKAPPNTINKITKYIPGEPKVFKNIDKALEVFQTCLSSESSSPHPLSKYCGILPTLCRKDAFVRHILPPFQGSIEIVIKDIGYILLRPTGKYKYNGVYEIWVPKGIDVCIREPLEKILESYSEFLNQKKSSNYFSSQKRPLVSSTYPMSFEEKEPLQRMKQMYIERTSHDLLNQRYIKEDPMTIVSHLHSIPPNLYWYYKW
ncbi:Gep3p PWA37_001590 [Arxiozyma heterogenica]|uniref:Genetic interactor of prohibitins 3, mitochondrial n=1 Tax=Arxiozyma heterogenica TaxID=278026 RepID=A0AAN7W2X8_9SACH|nr:hypothetical protein RI543_002576 [Kazachstania heterogenica]